VRALVIGPILCCLLAGPAVADEHARVAQGYRGGRPFTLSVVEINGRDVELSTARAFQAMQRAAAGKGITLRIRSGFRTQARQTELYRAWRRGAGHPAARPGYSNHQAGRALDLVLDPQAYAWLQAHARAHGFYRTVRSEPWHWEYLGASQGGAPERLARPSKPRQR